MLQAASTQLTLLTLQAAPMLYSPEARALLLHAAIVARRVVALVASCAAAEARILHAHELLRPLPARAQPA